MLPVPDLVFADCDSCGVSLTEDEAYRWEIEEVSLSRPGDFLIVEVACSAACARDLDLQTAAEDAR